MKNLTLTLTLLSTLAGAAAAQDGPSPGDRIEITFPSGGTIMGKVVAPPPRAPAGSLTLDLSSEFPGLTGTLTVPKQDIQSVRRLRALKEPPICNLTPPSPRVADRAMPVAPAPVVPTPEPPKPAPVVDDKAAEELQKARDFYARFPAPDWSPERRNAIRLKKYRGQIPTPAERDFDAGFDLWVKGRDAK